METTLPENDRYSAEGYFSLVQKGLLAPDERVELLDGLIVAMSPHDPAHASGVRRVYRALERVLGPEPLISVQLPLVSGSMSVPEPDVCVLPGRENDYVAAHPRDALLVVEVSDSSLAQDRLTKSRIYARAGIPTYWIVNLRTRVVEWQADPDPAGRAYRAKGIASGTDVVPFAAFPGVVITADDLLPPAST